MNHRQPRFHRPPPSPPLAGERGGAALAYFNRAANLYRQTCYAQAIQYYLAGLEIDPMRVEAYADLAKAYEMLGCWNQAIESLEVALRLRPEDPIALRRKQRILEEKSVYDGLIDELNLVLDASAPLPSPQHQPANTVLGGIPKIEHEFFTLTWARTIPQKRLSVVSQLVEHTYHEVGRVLQCYPQHKVPVFIEATNQSDASEVDPPPEGGRLSRLNPDAIEAVNPVLGAKYPKSTSPGIQSDPGKVSLSLPHDHPGILATHTSRSDFSLPQWAVACYHNGGIRLRYRPYVDSGIGVLYAVIRHEWTHLLVDQLTGGRCPNWLDEGLAQLMARPLMKSEKKFLQQARREGHFLPLHVLRKPSSHLPGKQRRLAYLQAHAIVKYIVQQFSFSALRDVLKRIGDGKSPNIAFQAVFGETAEEIVVAGTETE